MAGYSNVEYADIMYCYGLSDGNALEAQRQYQLRFPNRRIPSHRVFAAVYQRLRESGSTQERRHDGGRPRNADPDVEEEILERFNEDPNTSTRIVARQMGLTQWQVWFTLFSARLYPFHYTPVQALEEGDPRRRIDFCRYMIHADTEDNNFLSSILWTDESKFDRDGITNYHNLHYWAPRGENPHMAKERSHQYRFSANVWMGIIHTYLIGPVFLPDNLNGEMYEDFLRNHLALYLEDLPLELRRRIIYQHDGCPAHFRLTVRQWLNQNYPGRWIGRGGPTPWPARSPDLTPCDYYLWGHMKALVYTTPINNLDELKARIIVAADHIRQTITGAVTRTNLRRRLRACLRNDGRQFEQNLN